MTLSAILAAIGTLIVSRSLSTLLRVVLLIRRIVPLALLPAMLPALRPAVLTTLILVLLPTLVLTLPALLPGLFARLLVPRLPRVLLPARLAASLLYGRKTSALVLIILIGLIPLPRITLPGILWLDFRCLTSPRIIRIGIFPFFLLRFSSHGESPLFVNCFNFQNPSNV
jgi:hypothetical protein